MLVTKFVEEYLAEVKAKAEEKSALADLEKCLAYLANGTDGGDVKNTKCVLYRGIDDGPLSFEFTMMKRDEGGEYQPWFDGGIYFQYYQGPVERGTFRCYQNICGARQVIL